MYNKLVAVYVAVLGQCYHITYYTHIYLYVKIIKKLNVNLWLFLSSHFNHFLHEYPPTMNNFIKFHILEQRNYLSDSLVTLGSYLIIFP